MCNKSAPYCIKKVLIGHYIVFFLLLWCQHCSLNTSQIATSEGAISAYIFFLNSDAKLVPNLM